jgi:hypothetical protein
MAQPLRNTARARITFFIVKDKQKMTIDVLAGIRTLLSYLYGVSASTRCLPFRMTKDNQQSPVCLILVNLTAKRIEKMLRAISAFS